MKRRFESCAMVITGASSGLGEALAHAASRDGARLVLAARRLERIETLAARLESSARVLGLDLSRPEQGERLIREAECAFGGIDVLVLNAGDVVHRPLTETSLEQARALMDVNDFGPLP